MELKGRELVCNVATYRHEANNGNDGQTPRVGLAPPFQGSVRDASIFPGVSPRADLAGLSPRAGRLATPLAGLDGSWRRPWRGWTGVGDAPGGAGRELATPLAGLDGSWRRPWRGWTGVGDAPGGAEEAVQLKNLARGARRNRNAEVVLESSLIIYVRDVVATECLRNLNL